LLFQVQVFGKPNRIYVLDTVGMTLIPQEIIIDDR